MNQHFIDSVLTASCNRLIFIFPVFIFLVYHK